MKKTWRLLSVMTALSLPLAAFTAAGPASAAPTVAPAAPAAAINPAPTVVPSLHEWTGGEGTFEVSPNSNIVVPPSQKSLGDEFAADLEEVTGVNIPVTSNAAKSGDIQLVLDVANKYAAGGVRYDKEGYQLEVSTSGVKVTAPSATGLYYGTRSILQIMTQSDGRNKLPIGSATDWPDYEARGFILDVGRRVFSAEFINDYIKMMSYYKLNRFQIHLNDNQIDTVNEDGDFTKGQMGFRLKSENPKYAGLASADGSFDRKDWDGFEATAAATGVRIIPEIDVPAHSAAIIKWMPSIGLNNGKSDHLDLSKPETTQAVKGIFDEFMPWFQGPEVNFGADEYPGDKLQYRQFFNDMAAHIRSKGKQPGAWGSFTEMSKGTGSSGAENYDKDVIINSWNNGWYGLNAAAADGMKFINTNDGTLYVVPFADYYHGSGLNNQYLYTDWLPNTAGGETVRPDQIMGSMFAVWNDLVDRDYTEQDVHGLIERSFPVVAQKTWTAKTPTVSYADFNAALDKVGMGPGLKTVEGTTSTGDSGELSAGAAVTASSSNPAYPASAVTDGDFATRWQAADSNPASLTIDLGKESKVGGVSAEWTSNAPKSVAIETSKDSIFWTRVTTHTVPGAGNDSVEFPTKLARYVRLAGLASASASGAVGAWRISILGVTNVAFGAIATSHGVEAAATPADSAFDGNKSTRWSGSYTNPRWIAGQFATTETINQVTIDWEGASATAYNIQVSSNGTDWTTVVEKTGMPSGKRTDVVDFEAVEALHIKVNVNALSISPYLSIYEIEARDTRISTDDISGTVTGNVDQNGQYTTAPVVSLDAAGTPLEYRLSQGEWGAYSAPFTVPLTAKGTPATVVEYRTVATAAPARAAVMALAAAPGTVEGYAIFDVATAAVEPTPEPTESASPTASASASASTTPGATVPGSTSASASVQPSASGTGSAQGESPTSSANPNANELPNTGTQASTLAIIALVLLALGVVVRLRRGAAARH